MDPVLLVVVLQVACVAFIFLEAFIPSGGILGIIATALLFFSWTKILGFGDQDLTITLAIADLLLIPASIFYSLRALKHSPLALAEELSAEMGFCHDLHLDPALMGKSGKAISPLRPSGTVEIDGNPLEAMAEGAMIDAGENIVVVEVAENKIIVKPDHSKSNGADQK